MLGPGCWLPTRCCCDSLRLVPISDAYIANPQDYIRGNWMSFVGVIEKSERDDYIVYFAEVTARPEGP